LWVETPVMVRLHSAALKSPRLLAGAFSFRGSGCASPTASASRNAKLAALGEEKDAELGG